MADNFWEKDPIAAPTPQRSAQPPADNWWEQDAPVDAVAPAPQPVASNRTVTIPIGIPGGRGQAFLRSVGSNFEAGARQAAQGVGDILNSVQNAFASGDAPSPTFQQGNVLTGVPRVALGGLGAIFSPITAAAAPILEPVVGPVAGAVDEYVSKPLERATGYPSDVTTPAAMQAATLGLLKAPGAIKSVLKPKPKVSTLTPRQAPAAEAPKPEPVKAGPAPSNNEIRSEADYWYKQADEAGIVIKPETIQAMTEKLTKELADNGFHERLQPATAVAIEELGKLSGKPVTLKGMDVIRQVVQGAANVMNKKDMRLAAKVIKNIDDMVLNLSDDAVLMGDTAKGVPALTKARSAWTRLKKSEIIDEAMSKAQRQADRAGSGGNLENAIRQQFDRILNKPSALRGFTKDEIAQMEAIVKGRGRLHDTLRLVGKLSPSGNGLMFGLGGAAAFSNPLLAAGPLAGLLSKPISTAMTRGSAKTLSENVRRGGKPQMLPRSTLKPRVIVAPVVGATSRPPERTY